MKKRIMLPLITIIIILLFLIIIVLQIANPKDSKGGGHFTEQADETAENKQTVAIEVYLDENTSSEQIDKLIGVLSENPEIKEIIQHSFDEHKEKYFGDAIQLADGFDDDANFGPYLELITSTDIDLESLKESITQFDFVENVDYS